MKTKLAILQKVRSSLKQNTDEKTKTSFQRFFKEKVMYHGVKSATVVKLAKEYFEEIKFKPKKEIFELCEDLFSFGYCEESWIASNWAHWVSKDFKQEDFKVFEKWVYSYISNWATCDTFCNHTVGTFIEMYPKFLEKLKGWTKSDNRWVKRASAVSLIIPAKEGKFLKDIFEIADSLLLDSDDMVQKGYGWLLKEASRKHQQEVFNYVVKHKAVMPRTALRYAIEKMPEDLRKRAMER